MGTLGGCCRRWALVCEKIPAHAGSESRCSTGRWRWKNGPTRCFSVLPTKTMNTSLTWHSKRREPVSDTKHAIPTSTPSSSIPRYHRISSCTSCDHTPTSPRPPPQQPQPASSSSSASPFPASPPTSSPPYSPPLSSAPSQTPTSHSPPPP